MYENKIENVNRMYWTVGAAGDGCVSGYGTANLYDFNLTTKSMGSCNRGTHRLFVIFDDGGTGMHCNSLVLVNDAQLIGTVALYWGTTLAGAWSGNTGDQRIQPNGTTVITWSGTMTYQKIWMLQWQLSPRADTIANELFLGKYLELSSNPIYPLDTGEHRSVTIGETPKGVRHTYHNFDRKTWLLDYEGITDADKSSVEGMVDYCRGSYKPLWFTLNPSSPAETHFVRFAADRFTYREIISGYWSVNLPLEQEL